MSKILNPQKSLLLDATSVSNTTIVTQNNSKTSPNSGCDNISIVSSSIIDYEDFTSSSSILEFLSKEQECGDEEIDADSIFQEVSRLADNSDTRSVDEILREAEILIQKQTGFVPTNKNAKTQKKSKECIDVEPQKQHYIKMNTKYTRSIENVRQPVLTPTQRNDFSKNEAKDFSVLADQTPQTPTGKQFSVFIDNLPSVSVISEESTPKDLLCLTVNDKDDDDDDTDDATLEEITEGMETIELMVNGDGDNGVDSKDGVGKNFTADSELTNETPLTKATSNTASFASNSVGTSSCVRILSRTNSNSMKYDYNDVGRRLSFESSTQQSNTFATQPLPNMVSPTRRLPLNFNATQVCSSPSNSLDRQVRRSSMTTPDSGISNNTNTPRTGYSPRRKILCDIAINTSPKRMISSLTSPVESMVNMTREHALKQEIEKLQEKLKDTEERLQSLRIQHDSLSQLHRDLRENNSHLQEESEMLKLDVQHLNECANILRTELQSARNDRNEAKEVQKSLQLELEENRQERRQSQELKEKDTKIIQDLQRQCREMERILMRKHPDSVSALIVASKNTGKCSSNDQENVNSRKLLEQRIAQLEADAKEQDHKAQQILANVQARFNAVQSKYETHIADLETQVLSLQEINTKLSEKIESQVRTLDYFVTKKAEKFYNNCTQTDDTVYGGDNIRDDASDKINSCTQTLAPKTAKTRDHATNTIGTRSQQHSASSSTSSTANSTPNTSRPNSKQSGIRKPILSMTGSLSSALASRLPVSQSDSTISAHHAAAKEDAHLLATIRGMRVDLAIKDKAMQRLTRELDECKKTIKKLQREKEGLKSEKLHLGASTMPRRINHSQDSEQIPANTETQALREAQNKIKLLEADYKSLHDKRLQDLKTLQTAHERELASCHETVRILQQRLNERDEAFAVQKRRKVPVDYYALKAKVSSLERRHSEREERLHMLVEALSKGRLNGALDGLLAENNNQ